jgi:APA family basic amino acid/polyamine antiporter
VPFGPVIPVLSILSCLVLMTALPAEAWLRFIVWSAVGLAIYFLYGRGHSALAR